MKKLAIVLAVLTALAACSKNEAPVAPKKPAAAAPQAAVQAPRTFPSVYTQEATKAAAAAFEAAVKDIAARGSELDPRTPPHELPAPSKEDLEAFSSHEAARRALLEKLADPAARGPGMKEVMDKALATPLERHSYHMTLRRMRDAAHPRMQGARPSAPAQR